MQSAESHNKRKPNSLIHESSPYLLQHAYNPVEWMPFGDEAFEKARREDKPVLISVGYSACHWCHVMERESFEDIEVAKLMNSAFINVKVDREERSDVDMLYMTAVQVMTGHGGWPMNCFVMPDGRPFYGGTYFPKEQWMKLLTGLTALYSKDRAKVEAYAGELTEGIKRAELISVSPKDETEPGRKLLADSISRWKKRIDNRYGGANRAPKFPMPSNYRFLLRYAAIEKDAALTEHVDTTLKHMANGGIYDQLHGGFARYSTDQYWKVPHFEKMLYDNSQLAGLYAEAYRISKNSLYKQIATDTLDFVEKYWLSKGGFFYSAFDADSEGEEGRYYVWSREELQSLIGDDFGIFADSYGINDTGYWEDGNYILMRNHNLASVMTKYDLSRNELNKRLEACKVKLRRVAEKRVMPALDDKIICSWNALMCSAYAEGWLTFGIEKYRTIAQSSMSFILEKMTGKDGRLLRIYKNGKARVEAFLDDYAFTIEALLNCYLAFQDEMYLKKARQLCKTALEEFGDPERDFLYYSGKHSEKLVASSTEISDNVIPSSNSQMAINLFLLGRYYDIKEWGERAQRMLRTVSGDLKEYGQGYSNWACLALYFAYPLKESVIVGKNVDEMFRALYKEGPLNTIFAVHAGPSVLPLLSDRYVENKTVFYVCENQTCGIPVETPEEALKQLE